MKGSRSILLGLLLLFLGAQSCKDDNPYTGECYIPEVSVNELLNLSLPEYFPLQNLGEYILLESGNRGIFVVHNYDDKYYALERTCPYKSDNNCAQVSVDSVNLQLVCGQHTDTGFVKCCGSSFQFNGLVIQGPSRCNLKAYRVNFDGSTLYINN